MKNNLPHSTASVQFFFRATGALLLLLFVFQIVASHLSSELLLGVGIQQLKQGVLITRVASDSPAERAGLDAGALLVQINGFPISKTTDIAAAIKQKGTATSTVVLRHRDHSTAHIVDPGMAVNYHLLILNLLLLIVYAGIALIAVRARNIDKRLNLLAVFCLAVAVDIATEGNYNYWPAVQQQLLLFESLIGALQFALVLHLLSLIPATAPWMRARRRALSVIYGLNLFIFFSLSLLQHGLLPVTEALSKLLQILSAGNLVHIFWGTVVLLALATQYYLHREPRERGQLKFIILGTLPWLLFQLATPLVLPQPWFGDFWFQIADVATHLAFPLGILIAIFRYNLLDLGEVLSRRLIYVFLPLSILLLLAVTVIAALLWLANNEATPRLVWVTALLALMIGLAYQPFQAAVSYFVERNKGVQPHHLGKRLRQLSARLARCNSYEKMEQLLNNELAHILNCRFVHLDRRDPAEALPNYHHWLLKKGPLLVAGMADQVADIDNAYQKDVDLLLPLQHEDRYLGSIVIGRSRSGRRYCQREVELLSLFADTVAARMNSFRLLHRAEYDSLTGLLRRESILHALEEAIRNHLQNRQPFSIAMLDLDDFKQLNDHYGHLFGDEVLNRVGTLLKQHLPSPARVGRFGGEEFLAILPGDGVDQLSAIEQIRQAVAKIEISTSKSHRGRLSISIGMAGIDEVNAGSSATNLVMRQLIDLADQRLFSAKRQGKNRCVSS